MKAFLGWVGGILAAVISGFIVYKMTVPPAPVAVTSFEGMVYSGSDPVPNAMVVIDLSGVGAGSGSFRDETDDHGSYRLDIQEMPKSWSGTASASAKGFVASAPAALTGPAGTEIRKDIALSPERVTSGGASPPGPLVPHIGVMPRYFPKAKTAAAVGTLKQIK